MKCEDFQIGGRRTWHGERKSDSKSLSRVGGNQIEGTHLNGRHPIDVSSFQLPLEETTERVGRRQRDQGFAGGAAGPKQIGAVGLVQRRQEEPRPQPREDQLPETSGRSRVEGCNGYIVLVIVHGLEQLVRLAVSQNYS